MKVCGRREFSDMLKLRLNYVNAIESKNRSENERKKAEALAAKGPKTEEELQAEVDRELEETIARMEKQKKRQAKKQREMEQKMDTKKKMSVIASSTLNNDDELILDKKTWDKLKQIDVEDLDKYIDMSDDDSEEEGKYDASLPGLSSSLKKLRAKDDAEQRKNAGKDSDSDVSEDSVARVNRMEEEINQTLAQQREYQMVKSKKEAKKDNKTKQLVELQRQKREDLETDEVLGNKEIFAQKPKPGDDDYSENDDDLEEERMLQKLKKQKVDLKRQKLEEEEDEEKQLFKNPLLAFEGNKKKKDDDSSEWSDDDKYEPKLTKEQRKAQKEKEKKLLGKKRKAGIEGDMDDVTKFFANEDIEEVPVEDLEAKKKIRDEDDSDGLPSGYSSMDSDDIAETRALAKKMLRKKFRETAITNSFNRYAFDDDERALPQWFTEDEAKAYVPNINLTKEEVAEEKKALMEWNARPSKKVKEAKARKKMRLQKAMNKLKSKAQVIANSDISEGSKMRQIKKMYNKEKSKHKEQKTYIVNRSFNSSMGKKAGRNVKMVDSRTRADTRNSKLNKKKQGKKGGRGKVRGRK